MAIETAWFKLGVMALIGASASLGALLAEKTGQGVPVAIQAEVFEASPRVPHSLRELFQKLEEGTKRESEATASIPDPNLELESVEEINSMNAHGYQPWVLER